MSGIVRRSPGKCLVDFGPPDPRRPTTLETLQIVRDLMGTMEDAGTIGRHARAQVLEGVGRCR